LVVTSSAVDTRKAGVPSLGTWGQAVLLLLIAIGAYFQTWVDIWPYWESQNAEYAHGTLVVLVTVWLVWRARPTVNRIEPMPSAQTMPAIVMLSAVWVLAEKANVFIVYATLWPLLAFSALWVGLGLWAASRFALPLSFLYFAVPIWDYLKPPLQAITSVMVGLFTHVLGIPAALDGHYVTLPTATIYIAQDCSGAHFLCVALAVGVLAGVMRRDALRTRILILVIAGLLSMAFNWLRILLVVLAYLHPGLKDALDWMGGHLTLGWWVFALDLLVFGLVLRFVPSSPQQHAEKRPPYQKTPTRSNNSAGLSMSTLALVVLPAIAWALPRFDTYPTETPNPDFGLLTAKNDLVSPDLRWRPHYPGTVWEDRFAIMTDRGVVVEVYGNRYHEQTMGSELISRGSHLFDPLNFAPGSSGIVELRNSEGQPIQVRREVLSHDSGTYWLTLYTYFVDTDPVASGRRVQLMTARRSIYARATAGVVAVATPCVETCESRISDLEDAFIRAFEDYREEFSE